MDGTGFNYFENTGYRNERKRMHSVYLKNDTHSHNDNHAFECHLIEPLRLGKVGEVFLDYFMTYDIGAAQANTSGNKSAFVMDIKEFNIQSKSNNMRLHSKIVIPNEDGVGTGTKIHKGRKMNYVATINPGVYHKLSGTITDFLGSAMFSDVGGHSITFTGGGGDNNPETGAITVVAHNPTPDNLGDFTAIITITASTTTPGTTLGAGVHNSASIIANGADIGATLNAIKTALEALFTNFTNIKVTVNQANNGLIISGLNGGTITESTNIQNASESDITVSIDSPHFVAEFVIIEKD